MSKFIYKAKNSAGDIYTGEKEAADRYELYRMLRESGSDIVSVKEAKEGKGMGMNLNIGGIFGSGVKMEEKITLARNLGSMLEAGLPLSRAISVIMRQSHNKSLISILKSVSEEIDRGQTFSSALEKHPKVFPPIFISMVHAGEQGGTLADSLKAIAVQMDNSYKLEKRIRGAMMYPAVIVSVMIIIGILMFIFVIPTLLKTFLELNVKLPATTQFLLDLSNFLRDHGLLALIVVVALGTFFYLWSKRPSGKSFLHGLTLKLPLIGSLVQEVNTARTARTLSSLMGSGVAIVESLDITASVVQNVHFRSVLIKAREAIKKGDLMSKVFSANTKYFPIFFAEMLSVGEETGKAVDMLLGVAHFYEEDIEQKTGDMSTIIEPILMVFIGAGVGFFALAMISPMYSLVNAI
jgi:type IV pilus assembly protein PilC